MEKFNEVKGFIEENHRNSSKHRGCIALAAMITENHRNFEGEKSR